MAENELENVGARIVVIGVGGAGNNAVNRMVDETDESTPIEFYVMNTDKQTLRGSKVPLSHQICLGEALNKGLGAGGDPKVGQEAAEASAEDIRKIIKGADMVFIAAGMGGGTGTGAGPVIANIAKEEKALTIAIVTRPFSMEGKLRITNSVEGCNQMKEAVDSIIIVSNDKLLMQNGRDSISSAFQESDRVLAQSVKTVTDLITIPGIINLDFADIKNTLRSSGITLIGYGMGEGPNKAVNAAANAISSPLLETPINGARRAICSVTCGPNVSLYEAQDCVNHIIEEAGNGVDVKLGVAINDQLTDQIIVSVIATDFPGDHEINAPINEGPKETPLMDNKATEENEEEDILPDFLKDKNLD